MRRQDRQVTDNEQIRHILDSAKIVHLGMVDGGRPYIVPLNYGYTYEAGRLTLYMHGAMEGRKNDVLRADPHVFIEIETDTALLEGTDIPCDYSEFYACIMGDGEATIVTDPAEKAEGLKQLMKQQTGREFAISEQMCKMVQVYKVVVEEVSAKCHPASK